MFVYYIIQQYKVYTILFVLYCFNDQRTLYIFCKHIFTVLIKLIIIAIIQFLTYQPTTNLYHDKFDVSLITGGGGGRVMTSYFPFPLYFRLSYNNGFVLVQINIKLKPKKSKKYGIIDGNAKFRNQVFCLCLAHPSPQPS